MMAFAKKIVIFDAELIFNIRGLQFCLARSSEGIPYELKSDIYHKTLIEGLRLLNAEVPRETMLSYLNTIRPTINSYQTLKAVSDSSSQIKLLSFFEKDVLETTIESLKPFKELLGDLSEHIIYTSASTILEDLAHIKQHDHQIIVAHFESAQMLKQNGFQVSHVKFPNEPGNDESLNNLRAILPVQPENYDDYQLWKAYYRLPNAATVRGNIITGFGRGSRELGFPTANLDLINDNNVNDLVPGVYAGVARFVDDYSTLYKTAVSIGWNPYYGNTQKSIEAYILHTFENNLYNKELEVVLIAYVRAESTFFSLEELISAITYDVRLTDEIIDLETFSSN